MIRFVIAAFISILTIKGAFADINVFIAPNDLNYETNSTSEINHYLDELKKNNTKVDVDKDPKISNELKKYIGIVRETAACQQVVIYEAYDLSKDDIFGFFALKSKSFISFTFTIQEFSVIFLFFQDSKNSEKCSKTIGLFFVSLYGGFTS